MVAEIAEESSSRGGEKLTTQAPSPSMALSAMSGTGSHEGRPKTDPK